MAGFVDKKDIERAQLEIFRGLCSDFPEGEIASSEEPDFLIVAPTSVVGVELTELYWETPAGRLPRQSQESLRFRICQHAQAKWHEAGLPPVHVGVHFSGNRELQKKDIEWLACAIVDIAQRNLPKREGRSEEKYDWVNREYFPEELDIVSVYRFDILTKAFFSAPDAAFVPDLQQKDVVRALASKEHKYARYRERASEAWLLINISGGLLSTMFDIPKETIGAAYRSPYERVFVLAHSSRQLWELTITSEEA